jgi:hypothetical protein
MGAGLQLGVNTTIQLSLPDTCVHLPTHNTSTISRNPMSSAPSMTSSSSNFQAILDAALSDYKKRTGQDLREHPMAAIIDRCQSPDEILSIFQEQSRAFDEYRNGDARLIKWITPVVSGLQAISACAVLSTGTSIVSPS